MKTPQLLIALTCVCALISCASSGSNSSSACLNDNGVSGCLLSDVNDYRASRGGRALRRSGGLDQLARQHSDYMRTNRGKFKLYGVNVSHMGSEGRALVAMRNYNFSSVSENVAATNQEGSARATSLKLLNLWQHSSSHNEAILQKEWTHTGIGIVTDSDGMVFATQLFGTANIFQDNVRARFNQF